MTGSSINEPSIDRGGPHRTMMTERRLRLLRGKAAMESGTAQPDVEPSPTPPAHRYLPYQLTSFIGRDRERSEVRALLRASRLVTLTGSGGCGKTRLALAAADSSEQDPVFWIDLASISDEDSVAGALAGALGLRESPLMATIEIITICLADSKALILLDNCEHLIQACTRLVEGVLHRCGSVHVLATSREPLGAEGEVTYRVPSLSFPGEAERHTASSVAGHDGVGLFIDRAKLIRPNFRVTDANAADVAAIVRRLDGIPLAIELAAARTRMMGVQQIAAGLDDRFRLLTGGSRTAVPRQRTLQASVDWSHGLLGASEQALFRRLSVFAGGFTLDAAESVCEGGNVLGLDVLELLSQLVDKSLVQLAEEEDGARYRLLETIRHYAQARLADFPDESAAVRDRHLDYFVAYSEQAHRGLNSPEVFEWLDRVHAEHDNVVAALTWGEQTARFEQSGRLAANLTTYWYLRANIVAGRLHLEAALASPTLTDEVRARAAVGVAVLAIHQWDLAAIEMRASEALGLARDHEDELLAADALVFLGWVASFMGHREQARASFDEALPLAERTGNSYVLARALIGVAQLPFSTGELQVARPLFDRAAEEARRGGHIAELINSLHYLFLVHWMAGRDADAGMAAEEGLELARRLGDQDRLSIFLSFLAALRTRSGEFEDARELLEEAKALADLSGSLFPMYFRRHMAADLARTEGALDQAAADFEVGAELAEGVRIYVPATLFFSYAAELASLRGELDRATGFVERALRCRSEAGGPIPAARWAEALVALYRGDLDIAEDRCHAALSETFAANSVPWTIECLELLGCLAARADSHAEAARLLGASSFALERHGWVRPATLVARFDAAVAEARAGLGDDGFEEAFAEGRNLSLDEAAAYARRGRGERKRPTAGWASLTPMELDVVELVAQGLTNAAIGKRLFVSLATVKAHLTHVYGKVGVTSRIELAQEFSRRRG